MNFKKLLITGLACATLFTFSACGKKEEVLPEADVDNQEIANPITEYADLSEAEAAVGFTFDTPAEIEGNAIKGVLSIDTILIQVNYDGDITLRKAPTSDIDVSGNYNEYEYERVLSPDDLGLTVKGYDSDTIKCATWSLDGYNYSISASNGLTQDVIISLVGDIR